MLPLEAGIGATPAREAKAASLRIRPGWDQQIKNWAAVITPTPGRASSSGHAWMTSCSSSVSCSAGFGLEVEGAAGGRSDGLHGGPVFDAVAGQGAEPGAAVELLVGGAAAELVA